MRRSSEEADSWPEPITDRDVIHIMRVFDELIQNRDRNAGNLLWTTD